MPSLSPPALLIAAAVLLISLGIYGNTFPSILLGVILLAASLERVTR